MRALSLLAVLLLCSHPAFSQNPEYEFYTHFRSVFTPKVRAGNPGITEAEIVDEYAAALKAEGVRAEEIARRVLLLQTKRPELEAGHYDRYYADPDSKFNREPNAFLVEMVENLPAGIALDYAMGQGRNSIYLAKLGWEVWGFDPAAGAVASAQRRAQSLGLKLHTEAVRDTDFEFGRNRFDLIVFSWAMPFVPVERIAESLKPGGMVVMEVAEDYAGRNGIIKMFDVLRIQRYEIVRTKADFYGRREWNVIRMVATKP